MRENMYKYVAKASISGKQKRNLSCRGKALFSCGLIAALLFLPQAVWADIPEGNASGQNAISIGNNSEATAENSIALGSNSVASEADTVSVGGNGTTRRIVNVANGTADSDAATVGQLNSGVTALGSEVVRIIGGSDFSYDGDFFTGAAVNIGGADYYTVEAALNALYNGTAGSTGGAAGGDEIVIDPVGGAITIAEGSNIKITEDTDTGKFTVSVNSTPTFNSVKISNSDIQMNSDGITMGGKQITGLADGNIAMGSTDAATGGQLYAINKEIEVIRDAIATGDFDILVQSSTAVKYDDNDKTRITLNEGGQATQITNVADGAITATSTDAVTGGQLHSFGESVTAALGGTSNFENGKVTAGIDVGGTTYSSVQDALNAVNTGFENGVQYDDSSRGTLTLNKGGEATQVTNVADGRIAAGSRDAVTGNQLYQAYQRMNDLDKSIDVVGAHAAAMSALHPVPYNKYEPTTFSAGVGTYHDEYAMAIGAFHYIRPNLMVNVGASVCSDGDVMGRIGLSVALGKSTKKQPELAHDVAGMQEQMSVMQAKLIALEEQNRRDKEIIQKNAEIMAQNEKLIRELMQKSANK